MMIPTKGEAYLYAQDIFFQKYNDLFFFVEDEAKEELYFTILKKIVVDIDFNKVFPLCGKQNMIQHHQENILNKNFIYILDKDFDDILGLMIEDKNLIYLNRYSIENYLVDSKAICNFIISKKPTKNRVAIHSCLDIDSLIIDVVHDISKLVPLFIVVQRNLYNKIPTTKRCLDTFLDPTSLLISEASINRLLEEIKAAFENESITLNIQDEIERIGAEMDLEDFNQAITHTPGKYICYLILKKLRRYFTYTHNTTDDQFLYALATYSDLEELAFVKDRINAALS